jgi:predicted nuclease with TOPRIM domain
MRERNMSVEIHDKMIKLLAEVDELKVKEAALQGEKQRHIDQIAQSETDLAKSNEAIEECHAHSKQLKGRMDMYRDELFGAEEASAPATDGEEDPGPDRESEAKKLWRAQARLVQNR